MIVLVTGASGDLGKAIISELKAANIDFIAYSHSESLSDISWLAVDFVINCAAVIPSKECERPDYINGNIVFLQNLISFSAGKKFVHFSSLSELYKVDDYQKSKMYANTLVIANSFLFENFFILSLPTLNDRRLVDSIVNSALTGGMPVVDELIYNYMSIYEVAKHVVAGVLSGSVPPIAGKYIKKNLFDEIANIVPTHLFRKGVSVDRSLDSRGGVFSFSKDVLDNF